MTAVRGQYLHQPTQLSLETRTLPSPGPEEVQIVIRSTTICGSDLHYYAHGRNGSILVREPLCLGHEAAGEVIEKGAGIHDVQIGDKVALECGVPCDKCELCLEGRYNICSSMRFRSSGSAFPHFQGTLQERVNHPRKWIHRLPPTMSYDEGALLEPLAVAVHAVQRCQMVKGSDCLIFGAGAVGLLCAVAAKFEGCRSILIADIDESRLQFALEHGFADASYTVKRQRGETLEEKLEIARNVASDIANLEWANATKVSRLPYSFECTGAEACVQASIYATRSGGKVLLVGMGTPNHTLPISEASAREIDLVPTWRYVNCYPKAIEIMQASTQDPSLPDVRKLITHSFKGLDAVSDAFKTAGMPRAQDGRLVVKVVVNI